jgi:hypothetical protein
MIWKTSIINDKKTVIVVENEVTHKKRKLEITDNNVADLVILYGKRV